MRLYNTIIISMKIYCDGSCIGNPGPGGWSAIFVKEQKVIKKIYGFVDYTTNNKMELMAAIKALSNTQKNSSLHVFTDSNYLRFGITQWIQNWKLSNWKNGKIKNIILWQELDQLNIIRDVSWSWIKAHNGNQYNEMADDLARYAATQKKESI